MNERTNVVLKCSLLAPAQPLVSSAAKREILLRRLDVPKIAALIPQQQGGSASSQTHFIQTLGQLVPPDIRDGGQVAFYFFRTRCKNARKTLNTGGVAAKVLTTLRNKVK